MNQKETETLIMINYCLKLHLRKIHVVRNFKRKSMVKKAFYKIVEHKCHFLQIVVVAMDRNSKF